jgi:hypothetical protein
MGRLAGFQTIGKLSPAAAYPSRHPRFTYFPRLYAFLPIFRNTLQKLDNGSV